MQRKGKYFGRFGSHIRTKLVKATDFFLEGVLSQDWVAVGRFAGGTVMYEIIVVLEVVLIFDKKPILPFSYVMVYNQNISITSLTKQKWPVAVKKK